ncbi:MAG: FG-GAP repeat protein, partial [Myxococcales bacterium]|nr:FG-GAP repeat protein [Myxococcales bacterium]
DVGFGHPAVLGDFTSEPSLDAAIRLAPVVPDPPPVDLTPYRRRVVVVRGSNLLLTSLTLDDASSTLDSFDAPDGGDQGFGAALAVGDFNGDGSDDLAVGNPDGVSSAAVYLFRSNEVAPGVSATSSFAKISAAGAPSGVGTSIALGDLDGDGKDDLVVGAPSADQVAVFYGEGLVGSVSWSSADVVLTGPIGSGFGTNVAIRRDVTGLLRDDLVVDAPTESGAGQAYVFEGLQFVIGTTAIANTQASYIINADSVESPPDILSLLGPPSDFDGDGFPDIAVYTRTAVPDPAPPPRLNTAYFVRSTR